MEHTLDTRTILIGLFGGLALFLFGMEQMTDALKLIAGGGMKNLLARLTTNRFKAVFTGAFVMAVILSSSVTTVLIVGFITAGLMTLSQSIGIIMGANIGTCVIAMLASRGKSSTQQVLKAHHNQVCWSVQRALESLGASDPAIAWQVIEAKDDITHLATQAENHLVARLSVEEANRLVLFRIESEIIEYLKRVYYFAKRIATSVVEASNDKVPVEEPAVLVET